MKKVLCTLKNQLPLIYKIEIWKTNNFYSICKFRFCYT